MNPKKKKKNEIAVAAEAVCKGIAKTVRLEAKKSDEVKAVEMVANSSDVKIEAAKKDDSGVTPLRRFHITAYNGGMLRVNGFSLPVVVDLSGLDLGNSERPIQIDHHKDMDHLLGQTDSISIEDGKVVATGNVFDETDNAKRIIALNDKGFKFQASIGADVINREFVGVGSKARVNGRNFNGPIIIARKSVLGEISFCTLGADDLTSARIAAAKAAKDNPMTPFEQWLEAMGLTLADLSDDQKNKLEAKFNAETSSKDGKRKTLDDILDDQKEKDKRADEIVTITAKALQENPGQVQVIEAMSKQALAGDWVKDRYELELYRALRPQAQNYIHASRDEGLTNQTIEAALCLAGGLEEPEKQFDERTLDAASKRFRGGIGLQEVLFLFARRNGYDTMSVRSLEPLLEAAFARPSPSLRASGVSTLSLNTIISNTANKFLKAGFDSVETTWREIAARRPVKDFKQITSYSLGGDFVYIEVAPGGDLKHASMGEVSYTNQARTYGRMLGIDRRDIINDDLGALSDAPRKLGRGGGLKLNLVFWTAFMNNASFFVAGENNYLAGATPGTNDTRLNIEGLGRAETLFLNQTDEDGNPAAIEPQILLTPNALSTTAVGLTRDTEIRNTTANTTFTTANPHAGKFRPVRSSYLSNSNITGYSTAAWYLLSDPSDIPVIEVVFLNGQETPTVEQADADFKQLGIQMRGYHDFGVALQEPKGGVKMKGEA